MTAIGGKNYYRNNYYRPRRFRRRYYTPKVSWNVKQYVKNQIDRNVENKIGGYTYLTDATYGFPSVGNTWVEQDMSVLAQGTANTNRIGNRIKAKGVMVKGTIVGGQSNLATDDAYNTCRVVVGLYQTDTDTPLEDNSVSISGLISPILVPGLIKKYYDKTFNLPVSGSDSTGYIPAIRNFKAFVKLNHMIKYASTLSTSAQERVIISMITDSAAAPNPGFVNGYKAMWFEDA